MKITLLKDHYHNGVFHAAGQEFECDKETYDYMMQVTLEDRKVQVAKEADAARIIAALKAPIPSFGEQPQPAEIPGLGKAKPQEKNLAEASALKGNKDAT